MGLPLTLRLTKANSLPIDLLANTLPGSMSYVKFRLLYTAYHILSRGLLRFHGVEGGRIVAAVVHSLLAAEEVRADTTTSGDPSLLREHPDASLGWEEMAMGFVCRFCCSSESRKGGLGQRTLLCSLDDAEDIDMARTMTATLPY